MPQLALTKTQLPRRLSYACMATMQLQCMPVVTRSLAQRHSKYMRYTAAHCHPRHCRLSVVLLRRPAAQHADFGLVALQVHMDSSYMKCDGI